MFKKFTSMTDRGWYATLTLLLLVAIQLSIKSAPEQTDDHQNRPNILFVLADDWGVHAGAYGTEEVETPTIDRVAEQGIVFRNAFVSTPSCTESRNAIITGEHPWRLGPGALHHSTLPKKHAIFPYILKENGYFVGRHGKFAGGDFEKGSKNELLGARYGDFTDFLQDRPDDQPFFFCLGETMMHRGFSKNKGKQMGIDPDQVSVPPYLPDVPVVQQDIANYYGELEHFDRVVGTVLNQLKQAGELENTLVVVTSDHGWAFPRGKSNLYDAGTRVPLVISGPSVTKREKMVGDFVNLLDLAPTFLEAAGITPPDRMTGRSIMGILRGDETEQNEAHRSHVLLAFERHHGYGRMPGTKTYPVRGIRTEQFLYLHNYRPDRWPAGSPYISSSQWIFGDVDKAVTGNWMIKHANEPKVRDHFIRAFGKRPAEELYDLRNDPHQINNVAGDPTYQPITSHLSTTLKRELHALEDPRETDQEVQFNDYPYEVGYDWERVEPPESVKQALDLD